MKFKVYTVNNQHRGLLPLHQKSQWGVDEWEELRLFTLAKKHQWHCKKGFLWSIDEKYKALGKDQVGDLYLAKYCSNQFNWHGYPVSPKRSGDRPPSHVLTDWVKKKYIRKAVASKIAQGRV